ncbi:hypothetical protein MRX96_009718 [Rhipicephalus microplus]
MLFGTRAAKTMCPACLSVTIANLTWGFDVYKAVITRETSKRSLLGPKVPVNEASQRMHIVIGLAHALHYSSGVKNSLLLDSVFIHELTAIAPVRDASSFDCHPFNWNVLIAAILLAHPSLLYLVSAAIHHLCESMVLTAEDR